MKDESRVTFAIFFFLIKIVVICFVCFVIAISITPSLSSQLESSLIFSWVPLSLTFMLCFRVKTCDCTNISYPGICRTFDICKWSFPCFTGDSIWQALNVTRNNASCYNANFYNKFYHVSWKNTLLKSRPAFVIFVTMLKLTTCQSLEVCELMSW